MEETIVKQFINIGGSHYSVDGILAIHNISRKPRDILPDLLNNVVEYIGNIEEEKHIRIGSIKIEHLMDQFALEIIHLSEQNSIIYTIPENSTVDKKSMDILAQFVVEKIATSNEPILELQEIVDEFFNFQRAKTLNTIDE
jgi:hypothetical protein